MNPATIQPDTAALPSRLAPRLEALGVAVARVQSLHDRQRLVIEGPARWEQRLIAQSGVMASALERMGPELSASAAGPLAAPVAMWPGVWLLPLPGPRRRRPASHASAIAGAVGPNLRPSLETGARVALLLGPEALDAEQLHALCDTQGIDHAHAVSRFDRSALTPAPEVARLAQTVLWMHEDTAEIQRRYDELRSLSSQLGESYEELSLLYKLSSNMTVNQPAHAFLHEACGELNQVLHLRWMCLLLVDDQPSLNELAGTMVVSGRPDCDDSLLRRLVVLLTQRYGQSAKPVVLDDTATLNIPHLHRVSRRLLLVPIQRQGKPVGLLVGGDKLDDSPISSVDAKLCSSLANTFSIFLENTMLYEDVQAMFMGTLHALTASIDAKDSYTHGHSERVALMSRALAEAAGLDPRAVERVYIAGLVHDVGKIGVPESVLTKPGPLTDHEFSLIKKHPETGARILQDIRQMQDLIPGVLHHHERWDGRGYPFGLAGTDISLFGRLIALADSFDAMSSHRAYRESLPHEKVLAEVRRCAGSQFDPQLAQVFIGLDFTPFHDMVRRHQDIERRRRTQ